MLNLNEAKSHDITGKLNAQKLSKSDFIDRFLGFVESYDKMYGSHFLAIVSDWFLKKKYDNIWYLFNTSSSYFSYSLPFTMHEFIFMEPAQIAMYKEICMKICTLQDEEKALFQEFKLFYE